MRPEEAEVGRRVRFHMDSMGMVTGTITEVRPAQGGCLVRPDGMTSAFGWGWHEMTVIPGVSYWDLLARNVRELQIGR